MLDRARQLAATVKQAELAQAAADEALRAAHLAVPNMAAAEAPPGGEDDFITLDTVGTPPELADPRDHLEIGTALRAIDTERGAKVSGARFYFLTGVGAQLELALVNLAMAQADQAGFTPMIAPALVKPETMEGTGFLGAHADEVYRLANDDLYLVGTSEVALAGYHSDEILDAAELPLRYAGFSSCFRREAGSYGKDTRGIIRVHWFDKVEMFSYVAAGAGRGRAPAAAGLGTAVPGLARTQLPGDRRGGRRPRLQRQPQVRHRGLVPVPGRLPRADLDVQLHHLPVPPAEHQIAVRGRPGGTAGHPERHAVRGLPHHRLPAGPPPAAGRLGVPAAGAATVAGRARIAASGVVTGGRTPGSGCWPATWTAPCCAATTRSATPPGRRWRRPNGPG